MTKHLIDHRPVSTGARIRHFMRLARAPREGWHRTHEQRDASRLIHFLRIARGRLA
jgi:hypothetical protein